MKTTLLVLVATLAGCVAFTPGPTLQELSMTCYTPSFAAHARCLQQSTVGAYPNWQSRPEADLVGAYFAWLNAASERVERGEMTDADAHLGAAELYVRFRDIYWMRANNAAVSQQASVDAMLAGLAIMVAAQPAYRAPSITCYTTPMGGNSITTCH